MHEYVDKQTVWFTRRVISSWMMHFAFCITRMMHFAQARILPFSVDEIKKKTNECKICAEVNPRYARPSHTPLIKAT